MPTLPTRKVQVGALSTFIVTLILVGLNTWEPRVAAQINNAAAVAAAGVISVILQYVIPEKDQA